MLNHVGVYISDLMFEFKNYNTADWFSFYRVAAAPFLLLLIWMYERELFTWFLLISYSTDTLDGILARKMKITSDRALNWILSAIRLRLLLV